MREDLIPKKDQNPILLYSPSCPYCGKMLEPVIEFFLSRGILLIVRRPMKEEIDRIPGYPALYIPKAYSEPIILLGTGIVETLEKLPELANYYGPSLHYHEEHSDSDGGSSVQRAAPSGGRRTAVHVELGLKSVTIGGVTIAQRDPGCCGE